MGPRHQHAATATRKLGHRDWYRCLSADLVAYWISSGASFSYVAPRSRACVDRHTGWKKIEWHSLALRHLRADLIAGQAHGASHGIHVISWVSRTGSCWTCECVADELRS